MATINKALAARLFPNGDAIGQRFRINDRNEVVSIVGVAADASPGDFRIGQLPTVYRPLLQAPQFLNSPILLVRASDSGGLAQRLRAIIEGANRHRFGVLQTIEDQTDRFLVRERLLSAVASAFAGLSILVGGLGLYALLAYAVVRRTRELGVRIALGATRATVLRLVIREGIILTTFGLALGMPLALVAGRAAAALLFSGSPYDPIMLTSAIAVLISTALIACALPALRASRIEPIQALREE